MGGHLATERGVGACPCLATSTTDSCGGEELWISVSEAIRRHNSEIVLLKTFEDLNEIFVFFSLRFDHSVDYESGVGHALRVVV